MDADEPSLVQDIPHDPTSSADSNFVNDTHTSDLQSSDLQLAVARSVSPNEEYNYLFIEPIMKHNLFAGS